MKFFATLFAFACLLFCAHISTAQEIEIDVQKKVLDNGVTVLVWERPSAGRIGTRMFYKVDVGAERPGTVGLTHMLEHHLFKGSDLVGSESWEREEEVARLVEILERQITDEKNRNNECFIQRDVFAEVEADCDLARLDSLENELIKATEFQNSLAHTTWYDWAVQSAGGTNSTASTGRDWMKFDIDLPANKLELFMWTERSRIEHPVFRHFEPEKEVVVDQIRRYDNRPDGKFNRVLRSMTYDAHPYGWAHWFSDLTRATREDHWEIFYKYFIPQNTVIVVVGEVEAEEVFTLAETYWGSWQKGRPSPRLRTVEPEPVGQKRLLVETTAGPAVAINVPMPAVGHPDAHVFDILADLLGGSNGMLSRELVQNQNIATNSGASSWTSKYPSHFEIRVDGRSNEDLESIEAGINEVLQNIVNGGLTEEEIKAARSRLVLNMANSLNQIGRSAVTIGAMESIYGWEHLNTLPQLWDTVTADDLARVTEKYFGSQMQTVGHLKRASSQNVAGLENPERHESQNIEMGRFGADDLNRVRPGSWPMGGPVNEFYLNPLEKKPASAFRNTVENDGDWNLFRRNRKTNSTVEIPDDSELGLAIAEQPWYAPPWMAVRRPSGFTEPMPVDHFRKLEFDPVSFTPPNPNEHKIELDNGLRTFVASSDLLPIVQLSVYIKTPVSFEPKGKEGIAALTAELFRSGNSNLNSEAISNELDRLGASLNIRTDANITRIESTAPSASAKDVITLLGEILASPSFEIAFEGEQNRQALRASRSADNANVQVRSTFMRELYGEDHAFGRQASQESVSAIVLEDVQQWYNQFYVGGNITLAISGDVSQNEIAEAIRNSGFQSLNTGAESDHFSPDFSSIASIEGHNVILKNLDTRQAHIMIGHLGIEGLPEDHAALEVMHHILAGGGFISRMMELLRTQTGITSALYGEVEPGLGAPNPYLWRFGGNPETILEGVYLAVQEIRKMKEEGVTEMEFEAARTAYLDGLIPASYETPQRTSQRLAHHALLGMYAYQSPQYLNYYAGADEELEAFRNLTLEDVNQAAGKYLDPDNLIIIIGGPQSEIITSGRQTVRQMLGLD